MQAQWHLPENSGGSRGEIRRRASECEQGGKHYVKGSTSLLFLGLKLVAQSEMQPLGNIAATAER
eukprot:1160273-Pelagomonas_calceolata.AAC.5